MKNLIVLFLILSLAGCAQVKLTDDERGFIKGVVTSVGVIKDRYPELQKLDQNVEEGPDFFSYSYDLSQSGSTPLMNSGYFWFKISLGKNPMDPLDLQPPLLTVFIPRYKKYLKMRLASANLPLINDLANIFYKNALDAGGTDVRWGKR